ASMTIGKRLLALLAVPLVALVAFGLFNRFQLSRIEERSRFVAESQLATVAALGNISATFAEIRVNLRDFLLASDPDQRTAPPPPLSEPPRAAPSMRTTRCSPACCSSTVILISLTSTTDVSLRISAT